VTSTPPPDRGRAIAAASKVLEGANRVLILTGAGISAESGVPTFRGEGGLWRTHRAEDLATPHAFERDPRLVWEWYDWRRERIAQCVPNRGHAAIARWMISDPQITLVTQNVDGLHELAATHEAGDSSLPAHAMPTEIHGSIFRVRCVSCDRRDPHRGPIDSTSVDTLPRCSVCDGLLRPDVVWFGEALDPAILSAASMAAQQADACLVVGTSGIVQPAASLPSLTAQQGGVVVEVNPEETPITRIASVTVRAPAAEALPQILTI